MVVKVPAKLLLGVLNASVKKKDIVNFYVSGDRLVIQTFSPIVLDESLKCEVIVVDEFDNITIELNSMFNIIDLQEIVTLTITDKMLLVETGTFSATYLDAFEKRLDFSSMETEPNTHIANVSSLVRVASIASAVSNFSKSMRTSEPAVIVKDKRAYIVAAKCLGYQTECDLPDCAISLSVVKALSAIFQRYHVSKAKLEVASGNNGFCVVRAYNGVDSLAFKIKHDNSTVADVIKQAMLSCRDITSINFSYLRDKLRVVQSVYKQLEMSLSVSDAGVSCYVAKDVANRVTFGYSTGRAKGNEIMWTTNLAMMLALASICKDSEMKVGKGGRYLCLKAATFSLVVTGGY